MPEIGPEHSLDYRREVLSPLFQHVRSTESFYLVGAASMGKTRLLDHLMRRDVQEHYLGENAKDHWLIRVDLNRLAVKDENWSFYELLLSSVLLDLYNHENMNNLNAEIARLDSEVIQSQDPLMAVRWFEMVVSKLCHVYELKLCFLLDEFDDAYRTLPKEVFRQLRAIRDANKYQVSFGLFVRDLPEFLRSPTENESFFELLSRNLVQLGPYNRVDAFRILDQIETRRQYRLTSEQRERFIEASGGHAGLLQALISAVVDEPQTFPSFSQPNWMEAASQLPPVDEECRKIFEGLRAVEQEGLRVFARGEYDKLTPLIGKSLWAKGVLRRENGQTAFFCRTFEYYVRARS